MFNRHLNMCKKEIQKMLRVTFYKEYPLRIVNIFIKLESFNYSTLN